MTLVVVLVIAVVVVLAGAAVWWTSGRARPLDRMDAAARRQRADGVADSSYQGIKPICPPPGG